MCSVYSILVLTQQVRGCLCVLCVQHLGLTQQVRGCLCVLCVQHLGLTQQVRGCLCARRESLLTKHITLNVGGGGGVWPSLPSLS